MQEINKLTIILSTVVLFLNYSCENKNRIKRIN